MSIPPIPPELRALPRRRLVPSAEAPLSGAAGVVPPAAAAARRPATVPREQLPPTELPPIARLPRGGPLPATVYQQWAWEVLQGRTSPDLNLPFAMRFTGSRSLAALAAGLRELERRHEPLRTRMVRAADEPWTVCQAVDPPGRLAVPFVDLSALRREPREKELGRLATEDAGLPVDLVARPMFRARLVRLAADDHAVLCTLGHLVGDGWSTEILRGELAVLHEAFAAGRPSPLPEPPIQLADFAGWQRQVAGSEALARQLDYWRRRLEGVPLPLVLPGDWPPRERGTEQAACRFSALLTARIRDLARAQGATAPMVVLAAFGLLLAAYTSETDLVIESKVLGRPQPELAAVVGLFMSTLPHRLDLSGQPGFLAALRRTRDGVVEDYCNQDLPYPRLLRELFPSRRYLSRVAFNMLSFPAPTAIEAWDRQQAVFSYEGRGPDQETPKYDLMVLGQEDRDRLRLMLVGAASRFRAETLDEVAADLEALLAGALDDPLAPAARLLPAPRYRHAAPR